jgi:hypothetical protein
MDDMLRTSGIGHTELEPLEERAATMFDQRAHAFGGNATENVPSSDGSNVRITLNKGSESSASRKLADVVRGFAREKKVDDSKKSTKVGSGSVGIPSVEKMRHTEIGAIGSNAFGERGENSKQVEILRKLQRRIFVIVYLLTAISGRATDGVFLLEFVQGLSIVRSETRRREEGASFADTRVSGVLDSHLGNSQGVLRGFGVRRLTVS